MRSVHFIAIGGLSMSGIARILLSKDYAVSGSDLAASDLTERLEELGARIRIGHRPENLGDPDVVVVSSAIHEGNPELALARERGIPVVHRMDMLLEAIGEKRLVAIAGAHGKTTTTSMIAWILKESGMDPTYLVGGEFGGEGNAHPGRGDYAVFETDESDGSFLKVHADIALATNVDNDHLDYWGSMRALEQAFHKFLDGTNKEGVAIACNDDCRLRRWAARRPSAETYSSHRGAEWEGRDAELAGWGSRARLFRSGAEVAHLELGVPGPHNVQNAVGAIAAASAAGVKPEQAARHLASYPGARRRLERIGEFAGVLVLDDFAHHPTEIAASLSTVRAAVPGREVTVLFQPHRYSRTRLLKEEFGKALGIAGNVLVTGIYGGPGEEAEAGVSSALISEAAEAAGHRSVKLVEDMYEAAREAARVARAGGVLVTMGAGDVWKTHGAIREALLKRGQ